MLKIFPIIIISLFPRLYAGTARHDIDALLNPEKNMLTVSDAVAFENPAAEFVFSLHPGLKPSAKTHGAALELLSPQDAAAYGINFSSEGISLDAYRVKLPGPGQTFTIEYSGVINHPLGEQVEEYSRSFSQTPGIISEKGCYLSGASGWYPRFKDSLVSYRLMTRLPAPYDTVAGGARIRHETAKEETQTVWEENNPQDEITLVCGKYHEYSQHADRTDYYAFLLSPGEELAQKYLEAAAKYTGFYSELLGPYPYSKFALVENFWETGYGMPSFTLLGPSVIRLPFIINTSYPHEILHNWWGNGVFVDYEKGNWSEGLTAYLADYLIAENRGKGAEYRAATLQKYSAYVSAEKDFPLTQFRSRHSSASEAVGYGKSLMFLHMLRNALGDDKFKAGLRDFYAANRFRFAGFDDLRTALEKYSGPGRLVPFFDQWTERAGAPELKLKNVRTGTGNAGNTLSFSLEQAQAEPLYSLDVPALIYLDGVPKPQRKILTLSTREETFTYTFPAKILRLEIDPGFDVFRKLSPLETSPVLSSLLGAKTPAIILPQGTSQKVWADFAGVWTKDKENLPVVTENADEPRNSYWVLGEENNLAPELEERLEGYGAHFSSSSAIIDRREFSLTDHTFVFAGRNMTDPSFSAGLILSGSTAKLAALAVKLPHYGKYSWLVFDSAMNSAATGIWPASDSPLTINFTDGEATPATASSARPSLAPLPSLFSQKRISADISALTALPGGRGPDSDGLMKAAGLIKNNFKKAGLKPFPNDPHGNLIYEAKGTAKPAEYLVLSAHYDHLAPKNGLSYPGADDNASGVALLLELARYYAAHPQKRSIIFAAFNGEEEGRSGSKAFMEELRPDFKQKLNADMNFDTVGRLGSGKILILGSGSSDKWVYIFRGAGFVTGSDYALVKEDLDSSDQASFIEKGVPAVQFFSGPNADYHRPTDTFEKIDLPGIVKQAEFAKEIIDYLAGDSDFITRPSGNPAALPSGGPAAPAPRRVSTGLVPDFTYHGEGEFAGVKAQDITPGSPLDKAGVKSGSIIVGLNNRPVTGLKEYSDILKTLAPGTRIPVTIIPHGIAAAKLKIEIQLAPLK